VRRWNKERLARYVMRRWLQSIWNPSSTFISSGYTSTSADLNLLHVITMYNRIKYDPEKLMSRGR